MYKYILYVSKPDHYWFRLWLRDCSAPSHSVNQCWFIANATIGDKFKTQPKYNQFHIRKYICVMFWMLFRSYKGSLQLELSSVCRYTNTQPDTVYKDRGRRKTVLSLYWYYTGHTMSLHWPRDSFQVSLTNNDIDWLLSTMTICQISNEVLHDFVPTIMIQKIIRNSTQY